VSCSARTRDLPLETPQPTATRQNKSVPFSSLLSKLKQNSGTRCNTLQHTATHFQQQHKGRVPNTPDKLKYWETATHCNTAQHTATHYNTLQHTATHCNTLVPKPPTDCNTRRLQHTATHCNTLQHIATHCNTLHHTTTPCNTLRHIATHCNTRQHSATTHTATLCNTLQLLHTATHCNTLVPRTPNKLQY